MCYAALVEQNALKLAKDFDADIYWQGVANSLQHRAKAKQLSKATSFDLFLQHTDSNEEIKGLLKQILEQEKQNLEQNIENVKNEIYDLNYELAAKERKTLRQKLEAKQRKLQRLEALNKSPAPKNSFEFTYPHQNLFAVYFNEGQLEVSSFEYGHFRETGNPLEDILFHINHSPSRKAYGLYNTRIESLTPEYRKKVALQLLKSKNQRIRQAKQNLKDYQEAKGFFTENKIKNIHSFLQKYSLSDDYLKQIDPIETSYLQEIFPKKRAIIIAKAFEESVLSKDYYPDQKGLANSKHLPIEFFFEKQLMYFPAIYSKSLNPMLPLNGISIITMPPRDEVAKAGHDRSPICLNKEAALEYLTEEKSLEEYPHFFQNNLIKEKLSHQAKAKTMF